MLSAEQLADFDRDGFLVLPEFVSRERCDDLKAHVETLLDGIDATDDGALTVFDTSEQAHGDDDWFLSSGDKIRWFFEDGAVENGALTRPLPLAVNKLGHAMHDLDPAFDAFSRTPELAEVAADVGFTDPQLLQSMYIFKQPGIGGEVSLHCDHTFLWTEPQTVIGFWYAIEDATQENGCLWAHPGGHRIPVKSRYRMNAEGDEAFMDTFDDTPYATDDLVPLEADAGTLVLLHGTLPHWSAPNTSGRSRHAYTLHIIDGTAAYADDNWLRRTPALPLRGFV
ncbi:MAG: phytanoyl-CoA dioxygenase family protein [Actinomycetota bacterium]